MSESQAFTFHTQKPLRMLILSAGRVIAQVPYLASLGKSNLNLAIVKQINLKSV